MYLCRLIKMPEEKTQSDNSLMLEYFVPINESAEVDGEFTIRGTAITETTTSNGHTFIAEELEKSAHTLINVPLLKDHENSVDNIVGRVKTAHFDEGSKSIPFKAIVKDTKMREMIKDGLINSVSVGAHVNPSDIEEGDNGDIIPHNITFKELSLVAVPADSAATFSVALNNAWTGFKSSSKKIESITREDKNEMAEEEVKQPEEAQPEVEEVKAEEEKSEEAEAPEEKEEVKAEEDVSEKILAMLSTMDKRLAKLESSDADEAAKTEAPAEESKEEEAEEEEEAEVEESASYKIVAGDRSFTVARKNYSQRLTA